MCSEFTIKIEFVCKDWKSILLIFCLSDLICICFRDNVTFGYFWAGKAFLSHLITNTLLLQFYLESSLSSRERQNLPWTFSKRSHDCISAYTVNKYCIKTCVHILPRLSFFRSMTSAEAKKERNRRSSN